MAQAPRRDESALQSSQAGSPTTTFKPLRDPVTNTDMVAPNPAPNASAPAVPTCRVVNS
jgi:hypothetical protein